MKKFLLLLWRGWKKFAHVLGIVNTKILLTITYFVILSVCAIVARVIGSDLLQKRLKPKPSYWTDRDAQEVTLDACRHQF